MIRRKKTPDPEALKLKMASLCARSEQCTFDITRKLRNNGLNASDINAIISFLESRKFLSDSRFAFAYTADKLRFSSWGRFKIKMGLASKRIPVELISLALAGIDEEEYLDVLRKTASSKSKGLNLDAREDVAKLYRHLLSRGFESTYVIKAIREIRNRRKENELHAD